MNQVDKKTFRPTMTAMLVIVGLLLINFAFFFSWDGHFLDHYLKPRTVDWWFFQWNTAYWPKEYAWALWGLTFGMFVELLLAMRFRSLAAKNLRAPEKQTNVIRVRPESRFSTVLLGLIVVSSLVIFLWNTDWIAKERAAVVHVVSSTWNNYFFLPLTEFMVTRTVSVKLIVGLVGIAVFFVFLLFLPKIYRKASSTCAQIRQCFNRRVAVGFSAAIALLAAFLYFDAFSWFRTATLGNFQTLLQKYYFLPLTDFMATGVFSTTLLIPAISGLALFAGLFTLKSIVSKKASAQSQKAEEDKRHE